MVLAFLVCTLLAVADGDTVTVQCPDRARPFKVRVAEIDTPELAHPALHISLQPYAREARMALIGLCPVGQRIGVHEYDYDSARGRWNGELECYGTRVSEYMVEQGAAWAYTAYLKKGSKLPALELQARAEKRGLWAAPDPMPPWVWRKGSC